MKGRRGFVTLLTLVIAASAIDGWAFWTAPGTGSATVSAGSFAAATLSTPTSAANSLNVTWTAQASLVPSSASNTSITYIVERKLAGGSYAAIASGGCSGSQAYGTTSCTDAPDATGSYTYRAVAHFATWTATSTGSGPVDVLVDSTAPTVSSVTRNGSTPSNAASVSWTITFSEAVTGVGTTDFALAATGPAGASISTVTGSGTTYTVTASTGSGSGTLGLNLVDDDSIIDAGANKLGGTGTGNGNLTGQTYTIDKTAPTVTSINRTSATPTNATSVSWTVIFSETVTGVGTTDFALAATGPSSTSISTVTGSGTTYTVTASTGTGDGTLGLNLVDDDSITDAVTNKLGGTGTGNGNLTGQTYTIDKTAPTAPSAISATSGVVWGTASCSVTAGTRYVNGTATSASASTVAMTANVTAETGLTIVFSATSGATNVTSSPLAATASPVTTTQNLSTLLNGTITLSAYTVDAAGNASTTATSTPVLIKDTVVPALTATYDGGFLGLDPTVSGASECGATVVTTKTFGGNVGATWQRTIASGTSYSIGVEGPLLGLGSVTYSTVSTDRAGNPSAAVVHSG
jgi:hypothetical protein